MELEPLCSAVLTLPGNGGHLATSKNGSYSQVLLYALHFPDKLPDVHLLPRVGQFLLFWQYWHVWNTHIFSGKSTRDLANL